MLTDANSTEEDVIRCVCNIFRDEGKMIQCEGCEVSLLQQSVDIVCVEVLLLLTTVMRLFHFRNASVTAVFTRFMCS